MHEEILEKSAIDLIESISNILDKFYLAGGTGLSLQLGHRKSFDFDFFTQDKFNAMQIAEKLNPDKIILLEDNTLNCVKNDIMLSFFYYEPQLIENKIKWRNINIAHYFDISAEKVKTISQRGSKKDFYDIYALAMLKMSIESICRCFNKKFKNYKINKYHIIKSMVYFADADNEPTIQYVNNEIDWKWENVKQFFIDKISIFEQNIN